MANSDRAERLNLTLTIEQKRYLDDLAHIGIHGKTASEVAKVLISREIERLIKDGVLSIPKANI